MGITVSCALGGRISFRTQKFPLMLKLRQPWTLSTSNPSLNSSRPSSDTAELSEPEVPNFRLADHSSTQTVEAR